MPKTAIGNTIEENIADFQFAFVLSNEAYVGHEYLVDDIDSTNVNGIQFSYDVRNSLFEHCSWRASCAGDVLDARLLSSRKNRTREVEMITNTWIFSLCRYTVKTLLAGVGIFLLVNCFIAARTLLNIPYPSTLENSVTSYGSILSGEKESTLNISSVIIHWGCKDVTNQAIGTFEQSRPVTLLGFTMSLNTSGDCDRKRTFFKIEGFKSGEANYELIGASNFRWTLYGLRFIDSGIDGCLNSISYDYHQPWPLFFNEESVLFLLISGSSILGASVFAFHSLQVAAKSVIVSMLLNLAVILLVSFVGFLSMGMSKEAFHPACCCLGCILLAVGLAFRDRWLCEYLLGFGLYFLAARAANDCAVFADCPYLLAQPPVVQAAFTLIGAYYVWRRRRLVRRIMGGVALDWEVLSRAWAALSECRENSEALARLQALTRKFGAPCAARPRQLNRTRRGRGPGNGRAPRGDRLHSDDGSVRRLSSFRAAERSEPEGASFEVPATAPNTAGAPVKSVCQLYSQALFVAPLLFSACSDWAARAGGRLDRYQVDFVPSRLFPETLQRWMLNGVIKEPGRAIAKLLACYDGDVSRLLDVCRCRIVFDRIADIVKCVEVVAGLEEVRIVRVKNSMSEAHDAAPSGGFRAVVLNLRFDSEFTRRLGLENHVCEVQLVHAAFAAVVKAGAHSQYTDFRDLRGHVHPYFAAPARLATVHPVAPAAVAAMLSALIPSADNESDVELGGSSPSLSLEVESPAKEAKNAARGRLTVSPPPKAERGSTASRASTGDFQDKEDMSVKVGLRAWLSDSLRRVPSDSIQGLGLTAGAVAGSRSPAGLGLNSESGRPVRLSIGDPLLSSVRPFDMEERETLSLDRNVGPAAQDLASEVDAAGIGPRESPAILEVPERTAQHSAIPSQPEQPDQGSERRTRFDSAEVNGAAQPRPLARRSAFRQDATRSAAGPGTALDKRLRGALEAAALHVYLRFTLGAAGALDRHASDFAEALNKSSSHSVLFSSKPHAAYAAKPMGKLRSLLLLLVWLFYAVAHLQAALARGRGGLAPALLRLRALELQDPTLPLAASAVVRFGLLRDDCVVSSVVGAGAELRTAGRDSAANGYHFALAGDAPTSAVPVSWALEASDDGGSSWRPSSRCEWLTVKASADNGSTWTTVGGQSSWLADCADGGVRLGPAAAGALVPGALVRVDFRQGEEFTWLAIGFAAVPLGWLCALLAAALGRVHLFRPMLVVTLAAWSVWSLGWQAAAWAGGAGGRRGLYLWVMWGTVPAVWSAVGFQLLERRLVLVFLVDGLLFLAGFVVLFADFYNSSLLGAFSAALPCGMSLSLGVYLTLSGVVFYWLRWRVLRRALRLVRTDKQHYDTFWADVLRAQMPDCLALREKAQAIAAHLLAAPPQQTTRSHRAGSSRSPLAAPLGGFRAGEQIVWANKRHLYWSWHGLKSIVASTPAASAQAQLYPLFSLDQLFVQAICTRPILLRKVQQWAAASNGMFPCHSLGKGGPARFAPFSGDTEDLAEGAGFDMFKWCRLKSVPRAVEKVIRAYGLDVSRLVDVCRQAIVFEELKDISACLGSITADPDVAILRIKNRLDPDYDSDLSGGYRDVNVNLRFASPFAALLGIETHVCELQLILRGVAELKSDEGHRNYVEGRNLRAD